MATDVPALLKYQLLMPKGFLQASISEMYHIESYHLTKSDHGWMLLYFISLRALWVPTNVHRES